MSTLDEITTEKQRVSEALARLDAQREKLTSGLAASRSATGRSTPHSRRELSNARRSDATVKGTPAGPSRPASVRRCAAKSNREVLSG